MTDRQKAPSTSRATHAAAPDPSALLGDLAGIVRLRAIDVGSVRLIAERLRGFVLEHPAYFSALGLRRLSAGAIAAGGGVNLSGARGYCHLGAHADPPLWLSLFEFRPGRPTTVHDHASWGVMLALGGVNRYRLFVRHADEPDGRYRIELTREWLVERGDAAWWFDPPGNIHQQEALGNRSAFGLVLMGHDPVGTTQSIFDPATRRATLHPYKV